MKDNSISSSVPYLILSFIIGIVFVLGRIDINFGSILDISQKN